MSLHSSIQHITEKHTQFQHDLTSKISINTVLVQPLLSALGYDVTNPAEVHCGPLEVDLQIPETNSMALMLGGLVLDTSSVMNAVSSQNQTHTYHIDYLILHHDKPMFVIGSYLDDDFNTCYNTLHAVFAFSKPQLIIATNGCVYQFFADFNQRGILDSEPFASVDLTHLKPADLTLLEQLHKQELNAEKLLTNLIKIAYMHQIEELMSEEFADPSLHFINYWLVRCNGPEVGSHHQALFGDLIKLLGCRAINSSSRETTDED